MLVARWSDAYHMGVPRAHYECRKRGALPIRSSRTARHPLPPARSYSYLPKGAGCARSDPTWVPFSEDLSFPPPAYLRADCAPTSGAHSVFEQPTTFPIRTKPLRSLKRKASSVRFSTVAVAAGFIDTPRDMRGYAVKSYTQEGS